MKRTPEYQGNALPCKFYARGYCARGASCFYAHGRIPLELPSLRSELANEASESNKVCANYSQGFCPKGSDCPYHHQPLPPEKVLMFSLLTIGIGTGKTN